MKKIFEKRIVSAILSTAILSSALFSFSASVSAADEKKDPYVHCAAYYDDEGRLIGVRDIRGMMTGSEVDVLVNIYEPEKTATAKIFEWTESLEPLNDSGRIIDISDDADIVILHTNDMHGSVVGSSSVIGLDRVAALKKLEGAILADGGDATQGVAIASQSKGADVITIMNAAGYDVMAAGNHEFDYGLERFAELRKQAEFPIISANTYSGDALLCADNDSKDRNGANVMIEKDGIKVGIFALTTRNTVTSTKPENLAGIEFKDEIETAKEQTAALEKDGADVIIAITHMGVMKDVACTSEELAEAMADTGLDAIIDGHSHTVVNERIGNITIVQTGTGGLNVGRMAIDIEDGSVSINETMLSRTFFNNITPDADAAKIINDVSADLNKNLKTEIGENKNTLWGGSLRGVIAEARVGETNFGSLISDAMIAEAKKIIPDEYKELPIVAIENGGGFRASVPNGKMTVGHIIDALPFANTVRIKQITPAILYNALEKYTFSVTAQDAETGFLTSGYNGAFPQVGGMKFTYDPNKPINEKIVSVSLISDGTVLDRNDNNTKLIFVSNDYVTEQPPFEETAMIAEGSGLTEAVIDYINVLTENGTKPLEIPITSGRITTSAHDPNGYSYTAHISLTNADNLNDGDTVAVYVDGAPYEKAGTVRSEVIEAEDKSKGTIEKIHLKVLDVELPDGPHAIKLFPEQEEMYVNNYSGNGIFYEYNGLILKYPELAYDAERINSAG
ncbi:MAG: bifunctional metallophosphatase/5'-nucleotidase [Oscillospiraceae bacterium]|nr:bifunctional metallophosphatase/5'-nucleotidase [Oscillospiraceae bacterium]